MDEPCQPKPLSPYKLYLVHIYHTMFNTNPMSVTIDCTKDQLGSFCATLVQQKFKVDAEEIQRNG